MPSAGLNRKILFCPHRVSHRCALERGAHVEAPQFLQRFIDKGQAWAHLDIAGTAWQDGEQKSLIPSWGVGWGVRLLDRLVAEHYEG